MWNIAPHSVGSVVPSATTIFGHWISVSVYGPICKWVQNDDYKSGMGSCDFPGREYPD
jgi:hypothetical protein